MVGVGVWGVGGVSGDLGGGEGKQEEFNYDSYSGENKHQAYRVISFPLNCRLPSFEDQRLRLRQ